MRISTAEFIKNYGTLADRALGEPVTITKNGRDRLVIIAAAEYDRLKRQDRRALSPSDFTDEEIRLIEAARVPAEHSHLDDELEGWQP